MPSDNKELTYKLETNGSSYEDKDLSVAGFADYINHFSSSEWDFMTLSPSVPIRGSSFIQVGSPDAKTDYKMTIEIGIPKSNGVELFRHYSGDKEEVLQILKDYYLEQRIPDYKKWDNVSNELRHHKPRRFL